MPPRITARKGIECLAQAPIPGSHPLARNVTAPGSRGPLKGARYVADPHDMTPLFSAAEAGGTARSEEYAEHLDTAGPAGPGLLQIAGALHRQAHPGEPGEIAACRQNPCRLVPLTEVTGQAAGAGALRC